MTGRLSSITSVTPDLLATATLVIATAGRGFTEFTSEARRFVAEAGGSNGTLAVYVRHTSASLTIQENAGWVHDSEGPDDMPSHVKAMLTATCLHVPVVDGTLMLGTWQGLYLIEHRARPHQRELMLQFIGCRS